MNTCSIDTCDNPVLARGWCKKHYLRWYKHGDPLFKKDPKIAAMKAAEKIRKHGLWDHPLYSTWHSMMARCYNESSTKYYRYGARGITVCERWHDVKLFVQDLVQKPIGKSLDRFDNDGPYSPENCRWATPTQQARNRPQAKLTDDQRRRIRQEYAKTHSPKITAELLNVRIHDVKNVVYGKRITVQEE